MNHKLYSEDYMCLIANQICSLLNKTSYHNINIATKKWIGGIGVYLSFMGVGILFTLAKDNGDNKYISVVPQLPDSIEEITTKLQVAILSLTILPGPRHEKV